MIDQPSAHELIEAVREFLETRAMPELTGHTAFHARVAANALAIVARELNEGPAAAAEELEGLRGLLGRDGDLETLNRALCAAIRQGQIGLETPGLKDHLRRTTIARVAIDQPKYSGLATARRAQT